MYSFSRPGYCAYEGVPGGVKPVERLKHCGISPGLGFDGIEEVARMDEHVGFLFDDYIDR